VGGSAAVAPPLRGKPAGGRQESRGCLALGKEYRSTLTWRRGLCAVAGLLPAHVRARQIRV
jgi:hypothetical protein